MRQALRSFYKDNRMPILAAAGLGLLTLFAAAAAQEWLLLARRRDIAAALLLWLAASAAACAGLCMVSGAFRPLSKWARVLILGFCLLVGLVLSTFSPKIFRPLPLFPQELVLTLPVQADPACSQVELVGITADERFISYNSLTLDGWRRQGTSLFPTPGSENRLEWRGYVYQLAVLLDEPALGCPMAVTWNRAGVPAALKRYGPYAAVRLEMDQPAWVIGFTQVALVISQGFFMLVLAALLLLAWQPGSVFIPRTNDPASRNEAPIQSSRLVNVDERWLVWANAGLALALFLLFTRNFGGILASDSTNYISAARSLAAGQGYRMFDGDPYTWWPPLTPLLMAPGVWLGQAYLPEYLRLLHGILFAVSTAGWALLCRWLLPGARRSVWLGLVLLISISPAGLGIYVWTLSEAGFILCITMFFVTLARYISSGKPLDALLFSTFAALTALSRYPGVVMVPLVLLTVFFISRSPIRKRILQALTSGLLAGLPLGLWLLRNWLLVGSIAGIRTPVSTPLLKSLDVLLDAIAGWFDPRTQLLPVIILAVLLGMLAWGLLARLGGKTREETWAARDSLAWVMALFVTGYSLFLLILLSNILNAPIGNRLLSPIFVPLVLSMVYLLDKYMQQMKPPFIKIILGGLLLLSMAIPGLRNLLELNSRPVLTTAEELSLYSLRDDAVLAYLSEHPLNAESLRYSNCPRCLYSFTNAVDVRLLDTNPVDQIYLPALGERFTLIWFSRVDAVHQARQEDSYRRPLPDIGGLVGYAVVVEPIFESRDGGVYVVSSNETGE